MPDNQRYSNGSFLGEEVILVVNSCSYCVRFCVWFVWLWVSLFVKLHLLQLKMGVNNSILYVERLQETM